MSYQNRDMRRLIGKALEDLFIHQHSSFRSDCESRGRSKREDSWTHEVTCFLDLDPNEITSADDSRKFLKSCERRILSLHKEYEGWKLFHLADLILSSRLREKISLLIQKKSWIEYATNALGNDDAIDSEVALMLNSPLGDSQDFYLRIIAAAVRLAEDRPRFVDWIYELSTSSGRFYRAKEHGLDKLVLSQLKSENVKQPGSQLFVKLSSKATSVDAILFLHSHGILKFDVNRDVEELALRNRTQDIPALIKAGVVEPTGIQIQVKVEKYPDREFEKSFLVISGRSYSLEPEIFDELKDLGASIFGREVTTHTESIAEKVLGRFGI